MHVQKRITFVNITYKFMHSSFALNSKVVIVTTTPI